MTIRSRILWITCASALLLASGCGEDETNECGEPLYGGSATDEAWMTMVDAAKKQKNSSQAVTLDTPSEGQSFAADAAPPRFSWTPPISSRTSAAPSRYALAHPRRSPGPLAWLGELLLPTAEAHLPPYTGYIYLVQVTVPGRQCPLEVLTSELSWQVDAESWKTMGTAAGKDLSMQVMSAYLLENRLTEGPYLQEAPRTFRRAASTTP
ncbi:hypothetical protein [Stigmatella aurantiaca]|uniref:Conserved uncharacterized protein n=1 Tax=Stigmatella aurantiaca (strain DW4/3-1) TaxID=378806 RepID=Q096Q9_STIAD|nr:hypothetical protein [Stigmatella aurantiaca]ADO68565.1 conserved uncharacterized protein [Stigmatella aurantiaca DW4/3-1]EAU67720.1 hypothetical protein STIAU_0465 [Stigmatella aurantiaca DW4/3-1]